MYLFDYARRSEVVLLHSRGNKVKQSPGRNNFKLGGNVFELGRNDFKLGRNDSELGRNDSELRRNDLGRNGLGAKRP